MLKPTENILRSIVSLHGNPHWEEVVKWIEDSLIEQSIQGNRFSGENTIKMQGKNMELEDIKIYINKAPEYIENFRRTK